MMTETDGLTVRSPGSLGCRSPPSLSPAVSMATPPTSASPPPPPLVSAPSLLHQSCITPPGGHMSPPVFPSPPPSSRPHFIPPFYFPHYASPPPPPIHTTDPSANECKLLDYRNQKIAAFVINGETMLCLPQAFELFLKNLVGGLHTVYTKLKRLGIEPLVCNVEQVRVLRGMGAIQPGVNRCKLLCVKHFDVLYKDCTTARRRDRLSSFLNESRPGRPPKRPHEILNYGLGSQMGGMHGGHPGHGLTPEALMALKKTRMDGVGPPFLNGGPPNHHKGDMEKSPLLSNGYNPPPKAFMAQYMALNGGALPHPALLAHGGLPLHSHPAAPWTQPLQQHHGPPDLPFKAAPHPEAIARSLACRASYDEVLKQLDRMREDQHKADRILGFEREERENAERENSPLKTNGYGESDVLNLSSKSDSREDLSDAGRAHGDEADGGEAVNRSSPSPLRVDSNSSQKYHHSLSSAYTSYNQSIINRNHMEEEEEDNDKDEPISDNDDFDEKNDGSDNDDFEFSDRSFKSPLNNNNSNTNNNNLNEGGATTNGGLLGSLGSGGGSSNSSSASSVIGRGTEDRLPSGLPLASGLMGLGLGSGPEGSPSNGVLPGPPLSSLENLLGNIQNLLKVATESVRHEERQKEQLRSEFLRQKDLRERLEKQLVEDEKQKELYQRRLKRERRARRRLEEQLTDKLKRLSQYEPSVKEILNNSESLSQDAKNAAMAAAVAAVVSASNALSSSSHPTNTSASLAVGSSLLNGDTMGLISSSGATITVSDIATTATTTKKETTTMMMSSPHPEEVRPTVNNGDTAAASLFFSKNLLFNCTA